MIALMEITRELVLEWLEKERLPQKWLASELGVTDQAASNWLREKNPRPIPGEHQIKIRSLIEESASKSAVKPPHSLVLEFDDADYGDIEQAALREGITIREWAKQKLNELADLDVEELARELRGTITPFAKVAEESPAYGRSVLPSFGLVAAGNPGGPIDVSEEDISVPGIYDPTTHFVLRVNGASMEPNYPDRCIIICRRLRDGEFAVKNDDVVAADSSGAYFKRLVYTKEGKQGNAPRKASPHLISLNPDYPEVIPAAEMPIQAVVVAKA